MTYTVIMNSRGQITIPAPIRRALGLKPGDEVRLELQGDTGVFVTASK